jgi:hypothetical protein
MEENLSELLGKKYRRRGCKGEETSLQLIEKAKKEARK